jgi:DNA-binding NarL/FixJ family response regulator
MSREARPPVIFVGATDEDSWASQALGAGARGILTKSARPPEMVNAILAVHDGLIWAKRKVMVARIDQLSGLKVTRRAGEPIAGPRLSIREREVFLQAASGLGNKELADRLSISESTVKVHLTHIFQKLGVRGRAELAAAYHRVPFLDLVDDDESDKVVRLKN